MYNTNMKKKRSPVSEAAWITWKKTCSLSLTFPFGPQCLGCMIESECKEISGMGSGGFLERRYEENGR